MSRPLTRAGGGVLFATLPVTHVAAAFDDAAFETGAGQSGAELRLALAAIIATLGFLWAAWLCIGAYSAWRDGTLDGGAALMTVLRAFLVLAVMGAFIR